MTNNLLSLVEAINSIGDKYKINSEIDLGTGFEMNEDLKFFTLSELEFLSPTCVICYQIPIEDIKKFKSDAAIHESDSRILDKVVYLLCCSSFAHQLKSIYFSCNCPKTLQ
ncbi:MAG: hypothetical protein HeimC2_37910 [Candidatus Heimdallarchaeota archaeon LC_2]|nr:MAG: hypothetical protein HeimC2_37910 [Candidatus Heimdallarchaeota archaeon LC_2]